MAFSGYYYGYCFPIFNSMAIPMFCGYFGLSLDQATSIQGTLNFLFCFAAMFGVLSLGYFNNTYGRIRTAMGLDCSIILVAIIFLFDNVYTIMFARLLSGYITGMYNMNATLTMVEIMPSDLTGQSNMILNMISGIASLVSFTQQVIFSQETLAAHWKLLLIWPCFISVLRLSFYYTRFNTETPVFLFNKHKADADLKSKLKESFLMIYEEKGLDEHVERFILEKSSTELQSTSFWASNLELFTAKYLPRTMAALLLKIAEALTGFPFLIMFSTVFFEKMGINGKAISFVRKILVGSIFIYFVFGLFYIVGAIVGMYIVSKFLPADLMIKGVFVQGAAFFLMYVCVLAGLVWPVAVALALYITAYTAAIGSVNGVYIAAVLPSYGIGVSIGTGWLLWSFIGKVSVGIAAFLGETTTLLFFGVLCVVFGWLLKKYLVEIQTEKAADYQEGRLDQPLVELEQKA